MAAGWLTRRSACLLALAGMCAGSLAAAELVGEYRTYRLPLAYFVPAPGRVQGLLIKARINGGKPLRMVLDSGASHVVVSTKAPGKLALESLSDLLLVGPGALPSHTVSSGLVQSIEIGPLTFRNCRVDVTPGRIAEGVDGVIPLALFSDFLVRLDMVGSVLELTPYAEEGAVQRPGFTQAVVRKDLVFLPGVVNGTESGYVLLDTGAAFSAISKRTARALNSSTVATQELRNGGTTVSGDVLSASVQFRVAGQEFKADPVLAMDLSMFGEYNGLNVAGLVGYPDLTRSVLTVDYRNALVSIDRPGVRPRN
jgi:Aspartyl protease